MESCIILVSSLTTDTIMEVNQRRLQDCLNGHKIAYTSVDGSFPENKDERDKLFNISKVRGRYPQCFLNLNDEIRFVGFWDEIEGLIDADTLPAEVLEANPTIATFAKTFANAAKTA